MAFLEIHPRYRELLARQRLAAPGDFLALTGVVCSGHPDRHVARVDLGEGDTTIRAFMKREHRTRGRDRWLNLLQGFGWSSKSRREFNLLRQLEAAGIGCPEAIAAGESTDGRAFLLVREVEGGTELRQVLKDLASASPQDRQIFARQLGVALARLHLAGFEHADLYSKHVIVSQTMNGRPPGLFFLDWQRGRRHAHLSWSKRWRDLAALDATLADDLASTNQRLRVLRAYLSASINTDMGYRVAANAIRRRSLRLLLRPRIREMRRPPLPVGTQNLIWLEGEALQVTREFHHELGGQIPTWLGEQQGTGVVVKTVALPGARFAQLVTRWANRPWRWLWSCLRRQPMVAPEVESMKVIFRLQRYGVVVPRLLATGQKQIKPWQFQSFLLTEPLQGALPIVTFLLNATQTIRRDAIRQTARVLRQMHQATCYIHESRYDAVGGLFAVSGQTKDSLTVALATIHGIEKSQYPNPGRAQRDLAALAFAVRRACSRTELLRGLLAYVGHNRLTPAGRVFARSVLSKLPESQRQRRVAA